MAPLAKNPPRAALKNVDEEMERLARARVERARLWAASTPHASSSQR
jgi:hypothetical protein